MSSSHASLRAPVLPPDEVTALLAPDGPISAYFSQFEMREAQYKMLERIVEAFNDKQISLIEAGTGTGKSLAYLIPSLLWAHKTNERVVISTNTIPLQEQLLHKDIPRLIKALNLPIKAALMKGMNNFLCLRKLHESLSELSFYPSTDAEEIHRIEGWKSDTHCNGERASLPFTCSSGTWDKVGAESDTCNKMQCPYYQECYYFQMRKRAQDAKIVIVNHHLLFADMVLKASSKDSTGILPPYSRLILDEAHNIEDTATDYFASRISQLDIVRLLARLTTEKGGREHGKLIVLKQRILEKYKDKIPHELKPIYNRLTFDLPGLRQDVLTQTRHLFEALFNFSQTMVSKQQKKERESPHSEQKLRLHAADYSVHAWTQGIHPLIKILSEALHRFGASLIGIVADINLLKDLSFQETVAGTLCEIEGLSQRIQALADETLSFITLPPTHQSARWIELQAFKTMINTALVDAKLDIADLLASFFSQIPTVILCSATLTTNGQFSFIRKRLGLTPEKLKERTIKEYDYPSPFNYPKQAFLGIIKDLPQPNESAFNGEAAQAIFRLIEASRGSAFVLFTSYSMMTECFQAIKDSLLARHYNLSKQGDADRHQLIKRFVSTERSVLFGTDSFWEGIDIVGEALRCVIIVKLPFRMPSDPIIEARSEAILANGEDPFMTYSLPQAIVKFKQGFGRLIRHKNDRGCVICLDNRLVTKRYGVQFLNSLPPCQKVHDSLDAIIEQMNQFYRSTYHLTKQ